METLPTTDDSSKGKSTATATEKDSPASPETQEKPSAPETKRSRKRPIKPSKIAPNNNKKKHKSNKIIQKRASRKTEQSNESSSAPSKKNARKLPTSTTTATTTTAIVAREANEGDNPDKEAEKAESPQLSKFCTKFRAKPSYTTETDKRPAAAQPNDDNHGLNGNGNNGQGASAGPVVQIINGEIVLQESSMVLHGNAKPPTEDDEEYQVVEEEDQLGGIGSSYSSFSRKGRRPAHWRVEETQLFYEALRQVGTDFATMESFFLTTTKRTRKMLKLKYKKECIENPHLIEAALNPSCRKSIDLSVFDVTDADVANIPMPTAPVVPSTTESDSSNAQGKDAAKANNNDSEFPTVVEEDADQEGNHNNTDNAGKSNAGALPKSFWGDDEEVPQQPQRPEEEDMDHFLTEGMDGAGEEQPAAIALVSSVVAKNKAKAKKPKFRSRKAKGK
ncbi:hypothetical protein ACA910_012650 [Epithemia clementina (nom. ined.)]